MKKHDRLFNQISDAELKAASKEKARELDVRFATLRKKFAHLLRPRVQEPAK